MWRTHPPSKTILPASLCHVDGFPALGLLRTLRHPAVSTEGIYGILLLHRYPHEPPATSHNARHLRDRTSQVPLSALKHFRLDSNLWSPIRHFVGSLEHHGVIGLSVTTDTVSPVWR